MTAAGGDTQQDQSQSAQFPEIEATATKAAGELTGAGVPDGSPVAPSARAENFPTQGDLNHEAHRSMRWWAFWGLGILVLMFFAALLVVLLRFASPYAVWSLLELSSDANWHALVLMGVALVVLSAVPLSLSMGLMKMISAAEDKSPVVSTPTTEAIKAVAELISQVYKAIKP
ncbi:hypothetical protein ACO0J1_13605 [Stenotrophomonas acidaminiphila]|uniref:hypothetical protein n=1 Tax=Stenotrophomonas acidaminiphila TaxID=128780 RepID=UPI003BF2E978